MTPELIAALVLIGFIAGCFVCWPMAFDRGRHWAERHANLENDDEEWWQL